MADFAHDLIIEHPVSIRQKGYSYLRNQILCNHIPPGKRLVEGRIARQINVSREVIPQIIQTPSDLEQDSDGSGFTLERIGDSPSGEALKVAKWG